MPTRIRRFSEADDVPRVHPTARRVAPAANPRFAAPVTEEAPVDDASAKVILDVFDAIPEIHINSDLPLGTSAATSKEMYEAKRVNNARRLKEETYSTGAMTLVRENPEASFSDFLALYPDTSMTSWWFYNKIKPKVLGPEYNPATDPAKARDGKAKPAAGGMAAPVAPTSSRMSAEDIAASEDVDELFKHLARRAGARRDAAKAAAANSGLSKTERALAAATASVQRKYADLEALIDRAAHGRTSKRFILLYGSGGIGKTYTVKNQLKISGLTESKTPETREGYYTYVRGDIGTSISDLVAFFYEHKDDNLLVMDDCDGFLKDKGDQKVKNTLKAMMDSDLEEVPDREGILGNYVKVGAETSKKASTKLSFAAQATAQQEATFIKVDRERLFEEGVLDVTINGNRFVERLSDEKHMSLLENYENRKNRRLQEIGRGLFGDIDEISDEEDKDREDKSTLTASTPKGGSRKSRKDAAEDNLVTSAIGDGFYFTSRIIFISNLTLDLIDEAVATRCDGNNLVLTQDEFVVRVKSILPNLKIAIGSKFDEEEKTSAKRAALDALAKCVDSAKTGVPLIPGEAAVHIGRELQFRCINDLADRYLGLLESRSKTPGWNAEAEVVAEAREAKAAGATGVANALMAIVNGNAPDREYQLQRAALSLDYVLDYVVPYLRGEGA